MTHPHSPQTVSKWIRKLPPWASVKTPSQPDASSRLGLGEREAIALAVELKASQLLVDDRVARGIADLHGLLTTGTIGVLEEAAIAGLLNLSTVTQKLLNTNFRIDADVVREVLNRDRARRRVGGLLE